MKKKKIQPAIIRSQLLVALSLIITGTFLFFLVYRLSLSYSALWWNLVDSLMTSFSVSIRTVGLTSMMKFLSWWGYYGTILIWIGLFILSLKRKDLLTSIMIVLLSLGGYGLGFGIKNMVQRERPSEFALISETRQSFPSLHALTSMILYITIVYYVYHYYYKFWPAVILLSLSLVLIFMISFSRIYLGVHYFSDCIAGILLGIGYFYIIAGMLKLVWVKNLYSLMKSN